jgi:hypothetical protein
MPDQVAVPDCVDSVTGLQIPIYNQTGRARPSAQPFSLFCLKLDLWLISASHLFEPLKSAIRIRCQRPRQTVIFYGDVRFVSAFHNFSFLADAD